ncbi:MULTISPECIES: hypothetical protein [unclassified Streptomyces]|uniref:hypothetical protein n=1 Tax=unclassified Streptomyces TaxID=2593676 RepID=UPI00331DDEAC
MRAAVIVAKAVLAVRGAWLALVMVIMLPTLLPARWEYYLVSPGHARGARRGLPEGPVLDRDGAR